jgi:pyrroloquinoline-quinone synthase
MNKSTVDLRGRLGCRLLSPIWGTAALEFFDRIETARSRWNVLEHSFYRRWSAGELSREELAVYAGEYRHAVEALAEGLSQAARGADPSVAEHAAEEGEHVALWDQFAHAVGGETACEPREETRACVESWTAGRDTLEGLVVAFAIESGQPEISKTKLDGLMRHYGVEEGPATEYFTVHAERDHEHAAETRELIEASLDGADQDRLAEVAEGALRGNWLLLDGVERAR